MNPAYLQFLQSKGLNRPSTLRSAPLLGKVQPLVNTPPIQPQVAIRRQGFGTRFADTPPLFLKDEEKKKDNKIERMNPPIPKVKNKKKKRKKKK
tara:strand:- start:3619 stop:3900 length:282 start_codon:yes stop_codon:yes gene_type:complete